MRSMIVATICSFAWGAAAALTAADAPANHQTDPGGTTWVVNNQAPGAADDNPGTEEKPLRTIQAAADRAQPGDTVLVHEGIYREQVVPPRGGTSPKRPITYRAAPDEEVSIRGSEHITTWQPQGRGVWMVELPTAFFQGYNPFAIPVAGAWLGRGRDRRLGDVYCNGEAYLQKISFEEMKAAAQTWYVDPAYGYKNKTEFPPERRYPGGRIKIWANFGPLDPNKELTEINCRPAAIFPERSGLRYIVIDGFDIRHTAPQWCDIYGLEQGAIGTRYGYAWVIQNCTISYSRNVGISLGVTDEVHFPRADEGGLLEGGSNIPPYESIGHHLIRNNVIRRCGQCGIYGCYGAVGSVIEGNYISETNYRNEWAGTNQAAIKILFPIDVIIRNNLMVGMPGVHNAAKGIWLDWGAQNTRVTGNVICDFGSSRGLFLEVDFGPVIVDNNVIARSQVAVESNGSVLVHNLFADCDFLFFASPRRIVPYFEPHSTVRAGRAAVSLRHNWILNNLIVGGEGLGGDRVVRAGADASDMHADHNVYLGGARPFPRRDRQSVVEAERAGVDVRVQGRSAVLSLDLPPGVLEGTHPLVTSKLIGKVPLAEMFMEHPDGRPLDITSDFFGRPIHASQVRPGPFQSIRPGKQRVALWPKPAR